MKKDLFHKLFVLLFVLSLGTVAKGQTDLVRWNNTSYAPTLVGSNITASNITGIGISLDNLTWSESFFQTIGWPTPSQNGGGIDISKYVEFTISPDAGYKIDLDAFNFYYRAQSSGQNFQVRYSKDNFATYHTMIGNTSVPTSWTSASNSFSSVNPVMPGETVRIRIYAYNTNQNFHILRSGGANYPPTITGTVSLASLTNAINDNAITAQNFPVDINILTNDTYSTLSAITITQQPTNGQNITVNGLTNVTYTPNTNYTGSDSFKYTITDENGTSTEATVTITISAPTPPTAVADAVSVMVNETKNINVLANDTSGSGAFDYVTVVANPSNGIAVVNPDNTVTYTPNSNYAGSDSFQYNVTNIHSLTSNTVTVSIDVDYVGLVRWNGANTGFDPAILASHISASNITNYGGGTLTNGGQYNQHFQTGNWPNPSQNGGYLNESRYVQFTISPTGSYKIDLNQFNFEVQMDGGNNPAANFEIRYSKDFSQGYSSFNGTIGNQSSWASKSGSLANVSPVLPGETLYIRLYVYNTHNSLRIRHSWGGSTGPTITGSVSQITMADIEVTKDVNNPTANVNSNVIFTLEAKNNGPDNATGVVVTDVLPNGYQYVSSSSGSYNPGTGQWSIGNLSNSATTTLDITAEVLATGNYTNKASIYSNQGDPNVTNNTDSASIIPVFPDLKVSKTVDNATPNAGNNTIFTITAENLGPADATGIIVTDVLPNGYSFVSSDPSVGTYNYATGKWKIGNLNSGVSASLDITAKVLASGTYNNTATIAGAGTDPVPANNTSTVVVNPVIPSADLSISKTINNNNPGIGDNVIFTITVNNIGMNATTGVSVTDELPSGFSYVSSSASVGSYNAGTGKWQIGNLAVSGSATLTITAQRLATGNYSNTASVAHDGIDPVQANNTSSVGLAFSCSNCTHTIAGGAITVNTGEVYCLASGSWSGGVTLNGGTICISPGATFNASYTQGAFSGTIINNGTVTAFPLSNNATHTLSIINWGTFTSAYLQNFAGVIHNYGSMAVAGGLETLDGSAVDNYGEMNVNTISFYGTTFTNYSQAIFNTTAGVNVYSGSWDNRLGGKVYLNGANVNFTGDLDNSGYWEFERISSLSSTLNNYGTMKVHNTASNISSTTYLTNDDLLEFIDVPEIQYNGPMLTNNGTITVTHATTGNFKMNQAINQVFNNGTINVSGQFEQNAAGSLLVNNCTVVARNVFIGNGEAQNNGLIWATGTGANEGLQVQGTASIVKNAATGHIRGVNFTNSGHISGYGAFYFTGTTNMNTGGSMNGDEPNSILFFDASQTGSNIFDAPGGTVSNVMRPDTMTPLDTSSYNCTAPPSYAGAPPTTNSVSIGMCVPADANFDIDDYAIPADPVEGDPFVLLYSSIRLFDFGNPSNTTNNSTDLIVTGKGILSVDTTTGVITFDRDPAFTSGTLQAEYRISNKRSGDPVTYPSPKTGITITINSLSEIVIEEGGIPLCMEQTLELSNPDSDGVWSSQNTNVATVDVNGVVTGVSPGTTQIRYTKHFENGNCDIFKAIEITVQNCTPISTRKVISNPMLRNRAKTN